ncbi:MAG: hypothetical protein HON90_06650 [Halobacteriovoraceae bacterium]|nr:hypothetical protein [Halobacteriovoraceae bacterium]
MKLHNQAMIWKKAMKYPVLVIGIILFGIYLNDSTIEKFWNRPVSRFIPNDCEAVRSRLKLSQETKDWELNCPGTQLLVIKIEASFPAIDKQQLRVAMFKTLAKYYIKIGKLSNSETLHFLKNIKLTLTHPKITIYSKTDGQAVVELLRKKNTEEVMKHLKLTVQVKEVIK